MPKEQHGMGIVIVTNSGAVTVTGASGNTKSSSVFGRIPACDAVDIICVVTENLNTAAVTGQYVQMDTSPDGGTTWGPFWRSVMLTTSTTVSRCTMRTNGLGQNEAAAQTTGIATGTAAIVQNCTVSGDQRILWNLHATTTSLKFGLYAIVQPTGSRFNG